MTVRNKYKNIKKHIALSPEDPFKTIYVPGVV
jgi:hypothetical protein